MPDLDNHSSLGRKQLRAVFRQKRRGLSAEQQQQANLQVLSTCLQSTSLSEAKTVACYLANDSEISSQAIIEYCWQHNKRVLLPVLHPFSKGHLLFVDYQANSKMQHNRFAIKEPVATTKNICVLADIDLIFTPLVAFDSAGNRLGMGGGFYDRTLAPIKRHSIATRLIGLAHNCQQAQALTQDSWDIPLNGIATPTNYFTIS
jgi:5-formyltetrahydrofolate cyclo-ligase